MSTYPWNVSGVGSLEMSKAQANMGNRYAQLQNLNKKLQQKEEKQKRDKLNSSVLLLRQKSIQLDKQLRVESALSARDLKHETNRKRAESVNMSIQDSHINAQIKLDQRRTSSRDEFKKYKSIQRFNLQMNKAMKNLTVKKMKQEEKKRHDKAIRQQEEKAQNKRIETQKAKLMVKAEVQTVESGTADIMSQIEEKRRQLKGVGKKKSSGFVSGQGKI